MSCERVYAKNTHGEKSKKLTSNASKCFFNCGNYRQTRAAAATNATTTTNAGKLLLFMPVRVDKFCQRQEYLVCGICDVTGSHCVRSTLGRSAKSVDDFVLFKRRTAPPGVGIANSLADILAQLKDLHFWAKGIHFKLFVFNAAKCILEHLKPSAFSAYRVSWQTGETSVSVVRGPTIKNYHWPAAHL